MRKLVVGIAALLLSACGGGETYQVAPVTAFTALSGIGTPSGMSPLPGGLSPVSVNFESVPADNTVQWLFTHEGDDIARIVARVTPDGDAASNVTVEYVQGQAPDENWRNAQARRLIQQQIHRLVVEAVDSTMESRPFNEELRADVRRSVAMNSIGSMMQDASTAMDEAVKKQKERRAAAENAGSTSPYAATKPATDLSKYN
jgi:hypothetical protein